MSNPETPAAQEAAIVTTDSMILNGPGYSLQIPETAEKRKAALLVAAQAITEVSTPQQAEDASAEVKALAKIRNEIERSRLAVKAPVIALGKAIDERAKEFAASLDVEEKRLTRLISDHALKVEEARRAAAAEAARIAAEKEKQEREAEAARIAEERRREEEARKAEEAAAAAAKAAEEAAAKSADEDEDIEAEIARAAAIDAKNAADKAAKEVSAAAARAEEDRQAAAAKLAEEQRIASVAATQQTKGVSFPLAFEVEDIGQLYMEHPELVTLTVKTAEVKAFLKAEETKLSGQIPTVPGLRVFRAAKIQTR